MIPQIYVYDIVFVCMSSKILGVLVQQMQHELKMKLVGEPTNFLGFQVKQMKYSIFVL